MNIRTRTTYDLHFNDTTPHQPRQVRDVSHQINADSMERYYLGASDPTGKESGGGGMQGQVKGVGVGRSVSQGFRI